MKKNIFYLKLNEKQVRELIADAFAKIGCDSANSGSVITYNINFTNIAYGELYAQCVIAINKTCEEDFLPLEEENVSKLVKRYEEMNINYIYYCVYTDVLSFYITKSLNWRIKGKPKKSPKYVMARFYGKFGMDFRCLVAMSNIEINDELLKKLDDISLEVKSLDDLRFKKFKLK